MSRSRWTHNICEICWYSMTMNPGRVPVRTKPNARHIDTCCFCGHLNADGIYVRRDPEETLCKGEHKDNDSE